MNKLNFQNFIDELKKEGLSNTEKASIKRSILKAIREKDASFKVSYIERFFLTFEVHALALSLILVLIFAGTGVSFAAEDAVPGDVLYTVKVKLNEEIRDAVAFHPEHRARWSVEKARRRLVEAQTLRERDELDEEKEDALSERFANHTEDLREALNELEEKGGVSEALDVISIAESTLETYRAIIASNDDAGAASTVALNIEIEAGNDSSSSAALSSEASGTARASLMAPSQKNSLLEKLESDLLVLNHERNEAEGLVENLNEEDLVKVVSFAEKATERGEEEVARMYRRVQGRISPETRAFIDAEIKIEATYRESAKALAGEGKSVEAFTLFQNAISINARLKELLRSKTIIHGDLGTVIDLFKSDEPAESQSEHILENSQVESVVAGTSTKESGEPEESEEDKEDESETNESAPSGDNNPTNDIRQFLLNK